jgi:hypothetical protein
MSNLRLGHANPGSAAAQIDDLAELFKKRWHTNKQIGIPGYKIARSDRRDGRRSGGFPVYIRDDLKYKILCKSPDSCMIDYIFIELKFKGRNVLIGLVYKLRGILGLPVYQPILEDLYPRYSPKYLSW